MLFLFLTYGQFCAGADSSAESNCPMLRTEFLTHAHCLWGATHITGGCFHRDLPLLFSSDSHGYIRWLEGNKESQVVQLSVS